MCVKATSNELINYIIIDENKQNVFSAKSSIETTKFKVSQILQKSKVLLLLLLLFFFCVYNDHVYLIAF